MNLNIGSQVNLNLPALDTAASQIGAVTDALTGLRGALRDLGSGSYTLVQGINTMFQSIGRSASQAARDINSVSSAMGGVGGGGGGGAPTAPGGGGAPTWVGAATASAGAAQGAASGFVSGGTLPGGGIAQPGGMPLSGALGTTPPMETDSLTRMIMLTPLRFMRDRIQGNRETALAASGSLAGQQFAGRGFGVTTAGMMGTLARRPGDIQGTVNDYLSLMSMAPGAGAMYNFATQGAAGTSGPRAAGFFESVKQAQMMSPMTPVPELGQMIGGFAGNVQAQQQAQFMTGGAFSMVKPGGGQRTSSSGPTRSSSGSVTSVPGPTEARTSPTAS